MQLRHSADCLATGFAGVSTASTESFSSMRLGFLMIFDSRLHMRAASGNVTFITTRSCRMMLNDRKHPRTPSQNGVTEGECKLYILLGHHDNNWNYHLYPRHNDTYTMTKRRYKDDLTTLQLSLSSTCLAVDSADVFMAATDVLSEFCLSSSWSNSL